MRQEETDIQRLQASWKEVLYDQETGLKQLHSLLYDQLLHYAVTLLRDESQAKDLVQEVFIKAWLVRQKTGPIVHVKAWFYTLLRRKALNQIRGGKQGLRRFTLLPSDAMSVDFSAEDIVMKREEETERRLQVQTMLNQLPKRQKEVIFLKYFNNMEYREIAEIMGMNYQSVINLAYKAISHLKLVWKQQFG